MKSVFSIPALLFGAALSTLLATSPAGHADDRTMSLNTTIPVVPAPGEVTIDGKTGDWDLSAGVWSYNDPTIVDDYSLWTHLMWDEKGIYFLARFNDKTPLQNSASGKDYSKSWRADCFQGRVIFDDGTKDEHQMHINMYYATPDKRPLMIIHHGGFKSKPPYDQTGPKRDDQLKKWGPTMEKQGGKISISPWDDNKGYNMEAFWPWSYCRTSGKPLVPGEKFVFGMEGMWGNADGTQLSHRLADGIKSDLVNRIFMFRARKGWGAATIEPKGKLSLSADQQSLQKARYKNFHDYDTYGSIPIKYTVPDNRDVTIAIDDSNGQRVRSLFGQFPREKGSITDLWDGLDDAGNPVKPGSYSATVLHHKPISLKLFNSVYSSSTPPWRTDKGSLLWGSNHGHPTSVATRGKHTVLLFTGTEGGSGAIRINDDGIIQWADKNEFVDGTMDDTYVYALSKSSWQSKTLLYRFNITDGALIPFVQNDVKVPSPTLLNDRNISLHSTLAFAYGKLWANMPGRTLQEIDIKTGTVIKDHGKQAYIAITDHKDALYAITDNNTIVKLDKNLKSSDLITLAKNTKPVRFGISQDGKQIAVSDSGSNQVMVYAMSGKHLHTIGSSYKGNHRPAGKFVKTDLIQPMGVEFDHQGRLWIPEGSKSSKRVTCWSPAFSLVDQYWGQADYGAMSAFAMTYDSTRFIAHGIEFRLDSNPEPLIRKTEDEALIYHPDLEKEHQRGIVYKLNGVEYACGVPGPNRGGDLRIFRRDNKGVFRACAEIVFRKRKGWVDKNDNFKRDPGETVDNVDAKTIYWSNGWVRPDMTILTTNGNTFKPNGFSKGGVPLYDFSKPQKVKNWIALKNKQGSCGSPIIDNAGNISDGIAYHTVDGRKGTYPNPYGRHDAPAAKRGLLIAPFRTNGVVENIPGVGSMTALSGDRGEWFLMSMDGLFISSICQDIKGRVTLDDTFIGAESFGGFIWRDTESKKVLVQLGGPSYRLMEVLNLDTSVKTVHTLKVTQKDIDKGIAIVRKRQESVVAEPDSIAINRIRKGPKNAPSVAQPMSTPLIPGALNIQVSERGNNSRWLRSALAHNGKHLYVAYQVADKSPWQNSASQYTHGFIGGDCVDLQLEVPGRGSIRMMASKVNGKDTVVYWQTKSSNKQNPTTYMVGNNVANASRFDVVKVLKSANIKTNVGPGGYSVLITVPLKDLGLDKAIGKSIRGMVGAIYSDPSGKNRAVRLYWHNKKTGLVSDVPSESRLTPNLWGKVNLIK